MANKVILMHQIRSIIQYLNKGFSLRAICRELHMSRKTVTQYAKRLDGHSLDFEGLQRLGDAELATIVYAPLKAPVEDPRKQAFLEQVPYFLSELKRTGVTRQLLWQEYRLSDPDGYGYTQFCVLLGEHEKNTKPSMRQVYYAGQMVMIDFAGDKMSYTDRATGEMISCPVLVAVLPYSGLSFVKALPNATLTHTMTALNECFDFFEGVPQAIKTDNMKQIVTKPSRYEPTFTEAFIQWAQHNDIAIVTTRVARPKDKAPVENDVKIAYRRIYAPLRDHVFFSLAALNKAITEQQNIHNQLFYQNRDYSRMDKFISEEKGTLQPLPASSFVIKHKVQAKVQKNYHITLGEDWHHYSVPYQYIGKTVSAVYDADTVEIYFQFQRIALHQRSYKRHDYTTGDAHMPDGHRCYQERRGWTPDYFIRKAAAVGTCTRRYIEQLLKGKHFTEQCYNACVGILRLGSQYGNNRLEAACSRALTGEVYTYRTIDNILKNNFDKLPLCQQTELFQTPAHDNIRGPEAYK